jgi:hypothetical protein
MGVREGQEHAVPANPQAQGEVFTLRLTVRQRDNLMWLLESYLDELDPKPTWRDACQDVYRNLFHMKPHAQLLHDLRRLGEEQRLEVLRSFCCECGADDPRCQCWNDE